MTLVPLDPQILRQNPQLAALDLLVQASEIAIIAIIAAHPSIECALPRRPLPIDGLADRVVHEAWLMLEAVDRYRVLVHDLERLRRGTLLDDDLSL